MEKVNCLVIFSTLNQITNYLMIRKFKPDMIFNITYSEQVRKKFKYGIDTDIWDNNLKNVLSKVPENIELEGGEYLDVDKFKEKIIKQIKASTTEGDVIYWHITGGQRIYALMIQDIIKEEEMSKRNNTIFYLEGNSEKMIALNNEGYDFNLSKEYFFDSKAIDFDKAFRLMGFKTKELKSTTQLKQYGNQVKKYDLENKFYTNLYKMLNEERNLLIEVDFKDKKVSSYVCKGSIRDLLVRSNSIKGKENRIEFAKQIFKKIKSDLGDYDILQSKELNQSYPAGYIFEKLVGYKIYNCIKDNKTVLGMEMSLKVYVTNSEDLTDELDIVLLTNTGRIINFECKSGYMSGDNAKSHHFTTYKLSGVFGAPVFLTPLFQGEENGSNKDELKHLIAARRAAERTGLKTIFLDKIEYEISQLFKEYRG